ncbi:Rossmann-fold NAD(P)-binding domain-containing protein [Parerythrobacter jejuensis]|uniref:SDR family NAD(P)-dependent oxidoreductase n=1 Tax=Parerythrobacter jejuensis TaxID=795812 RepID=A0A845AQP7_9SPHN|nr:SDR family NAD(P)-dependent oxidoreductase [Parerythrobacter jejuensis]MXP30826.1 SDR family NAD(P)-dependent oxidoreductase [Parerythrobacter jejuensis]MXP33586.1 SDR family NAD(P)-dependent oxidoreductase [Parerythrobacter jejuensis]
MKQVFIFGLGYSAKRIAAALERQGWSVASTGSDGTVAFEDGDAVRAALQQSTHVLSSVPPDRDTGADAVLETYGALLDHSWLGYLSSTGVYGDAGGAWVDETTPTGGGRRSARTQCDAQWQEREARIFRLPGIYGPGRSALDRVRNGAAKRIDIPGQIFSRIHVDDIASGVLAGIEGPPGAYNLGDDMPCSQNAVIEEACSLLGIDPPPLQSIEEADLSPMARGFYAENRRVANGKAKRVLGWEPAYPDYRAGLRSLL